jgi:hypothetical protein
VWARHHSSSFVTTNKTAQPNSGNDNILCHIESGALGSKLNVGMFFKHISYQDYDKNNFDIQNEGRYTV